MTNCTDLQILLGQEESRFPNHNPLKSCPQMITCICSMLFRLLCSYKCTGRPCKAQYEPNVCQIWQGSGCDLLRSHLAMICFVSLMFSQSIFVEETGGFRVPGGRQESLPKREQWCLECASVSPHPWAACLVLWRWALSDHHSGGCGGSRFSIFPKGLPGSP